MAARPVRTFLSSALRREVDEGKPIFYVYTSRAVRNGAPGDRLYCVASHSKDEYGHFLIAWKATVTDRGIKHPRYRRLLSPKVDGLSKKLCSMGRALSEPTANFFPDSSHYRRVSLPDAIRICTGAASSTPRTGLGSMVEISKAMEEVSQQMGRGSPPKRTERVEVVNLRNGTEVQIAHSVRLTIEEAAAKYPNWRNMVVVVHNDELNRTNRRKK